MHTHSFLILVLCTLSYHEAVTPKDETQSLQKLKFRTPTQDALIDTNETEESKLESTDTEHGPQNPYAESEIINPSVTKLPDFGSTLKQLWDNMPIKNTEYKVASEIQTTNADKKMRNH